MPPEGCAGHFKLGSLLSLTRTVQNSAKLRSVLGQRASKLINVPGLESVPGRKNRALSIDALAPLLLPWCNFVDRVDACTCAGV